MRKMTTILGLGLVALLGLALAPPAAATTCYYISPGATPFGSGQVFRSGVSADPDCYAIARYAEGDAGVGCYAVATSGWVFDTWETCTGTVITWSSTQSSCLYSSFPASNVTCRARFKRP